MAVVKTCWSRPASRITASSEIRVPLRRDDAGVPEKLL
jgi:hypothetical protein